MISVFGFRNKIKCSSQVSKTDKSGIIVGLTFLVLRLDFRFVFDSTTG